MFKKTIMAITFASIAVMTASTGALAGGGHGHGIRHGHGHWGGHWRHGHRHWRHGHRHWKRGYAVRLYTPNYYVPSCYKYKKRWKWTGKKYWFRKYKACRILKN